MTSDSKSSQLSLDKPLSQRYVSPGSDTRKSSTSSSKKRASRAGTRSVSTLSAAQLERKRANDREAQRAIRQRTKDHIDHLERSINELRGSQEANEKLVHVTQQRNRELEDEIAYLRTKLGEAGFTVEHRAADQSLLSVPSASPIHPSNPAMQRTGSMSTPSPHSITTQSSGSRHGSWSNPAGIVGAANGGMGLPSTTTVSGAPNMTAWRSHDTPALGSTLHDHVQTAGPPYQHNQRVDWQLSTAPYQTYASSEQPRPEQYETADAQQHGFQQTTVQGYCGSESPQSQGYHPHLNTQSEFSGIPVSSGSSAYQAPGQASFSQSAGAFPVTPIQISSSGGDFTTSPTGQMQPPPLPNSTYSSGRNELPFGAQQYRDGGSGRSYPLTQFGTA